MSETTKQQTDRLLSMSRAELIMHVQDLTLENERYRAVLDRIGKAWSGYSEWATQALEKK
jgi:hypothetical protein